QHHQGAHAVGGVNAGPHELRLAPPGSDHARDHRVNGDDQRDPEDQTPKGRHLIHRSGAIAPQCGEASSLALLGPPRAPPLAPAAQVRLRSPAIATSFVKGWDHQFTLGPFLASYFDGHFAITPSGETSRLFAAVSLPLQTTSASSLKVSGTMPA